MKYKSTIIKISSHPEYANPVYGEGVTHVNVQDEAAGPFITLLQVGEEKFECVRVDMDELEMITAEAKKLIGQFPKEKKAWTTPTQTLTNYQCILAKQSNHNQLNVTIQNVTCTGLILLNIRWNFVLFVAILEIFGLNRFWKDWNHCLKMRRYNLDTAGIGRSERD